MKTATTIARNINAFTRSAGKVSEAGQALAADIIAHHVAHGGAELATKLIEGLGPRTAKVMRDYLCKHGPFTAVADNLAFDKAKRAKLKLSDTTAIEAYVATLPQWDTVMKRPAKPKAAPATLGEMLYSFADKLDGTEQSEAATFAALIRAAWSQYQANEGRIHFECVVDEVDPVTEEIADLMARRATQTAQASSAVEMLAA